MHIVVASIQILHEDTEKFLFWKILAMYTCTSDVWGFKINIPVGCLNLTTDFRFTGL